MSDLFDVRQFSSWEEFETYATGLFGPDSNKWPFICPSCKTVSTGEDFETVGADPEMAKHECISRHVDPDFTGKDDSKPHCMWTSYGLFSGPWFVGSILDVDETGIFPLAEKTNVDPVIGEVTP